MSKQELCNLLEAITDELVNKYGAIETKDIVRKFYTHLLIRGENTRAPRLFKQSMDTLLAKHLAEVKN